MNKTQSIAASHGVRGDSDPLPGMQFRLTLTQRTPDYFQFQAKTNEGGCIIGDSIDLACAISQFASGSRLERLRKAIRRLALNVHRVQESAADMILAESSFRAWSRAHA